MKVALFSRFPRDATTPRGGVETVTVGLVRALAKLEDIQPLVVTLERGRRHLEIEHFEDVPVHRLPGSLWPLMFDVVGGPGRRRVRRYLIELEPDVVHFHEVYGLGISTLPMPVLFTVHGFNHANIPAEEQRLAWVRAPLWRRIEAWGLARHRHIVSITPYVRRHIEPLTSAHIYDIENPLDEAFFAIHRSEVRGQIFFAGWIKPRKNPLGLVQAFASVIRAGVDAHLHIAGEETNPAYAKQVREAIRSLGVSNRVRLLGRLSPAEIRHELAAASVFVLPSLQENAPMAISEAMAVGVPVISSNRCGMPYMVEEGHTGYLIDPKHTDAMADRLKRLLTDDDLRARMGAAARSAAERRFHPAAVARRTVEVYRSLLGQAHRGNSCA